MEAWARLRVMRPGVGAAFVFCSVLFCLSKKVPKKDIPGQGLQLSVGFQKYFVIQTAPGAVNAPRLFGFAYL